MAIKISGSTIIDDSRVLINTGNVGVGTTNPNSVVSVSNTSIVHAGIVTANKLYGDGSSLTNLPGGGGGAPGASTVDVAVNSSDASQFVTFVASGAGNRQILVDGGLRYNPSSNTLTATTFSGNLPTTDLTGTITNAQLAGSIENSKLVNDSVSFGGVSLDLGQSDATPAFDLSDATNYPTSSLSGTITNAQLAGSIADGKLASTFLKNVVEDTTPQLGGNLDANTKDITGVSSLNVAGVSTIGLLKVSGSVDTLTLMHQYAGDSDWHFKSLNAAQAIDYTFFGAFNHKIAEFKDGGSVDLYYDNSKKFETINEGVLVSGIVSATSFSGNGSGLTNLNVPGISTSGSSTFTNLNVTGVATFSSAINATDIIKGYEYTAAPFGSTVTLAVTVASKDSTHRYNGTGSNNAYVIDGIQSPFLTLTPGRTYRFTNDNTGSHPFRFYLEADKTTQYDTNVNFQNTYTEITITDETPTILHYQCSSHPFMGNAIQTNANVVNTNYPATIRSTLNVTGVSTFAGNINANGNIVGDNSTNITGIDGITASTFSGSGASLTALTGASAATYGDGSNVAQIVVDSNGRITSISNVSISGGGGGATDKIEEGNTSAEVIDTGSDGRFVVKTEGSERLRITSAGNVGIGTTNPGSTLEINVGTALSAFDIQGSAGQLFSVTNSLTSGSIFSVNDVSGIPSIDVNADGTIQLAPFGSTEKVGIGTTNPTSKLHVNGNVRVTGVVTATTFSGSGASLTALTGASAATYGDGSNVAQIVVDSNGRITSISNVSISGGGGGGVTVQDEGTPLSTTATTLNFVGSGVVASGTGATKTITISGGGGGATDKIEEGNTSAEVIDTGSDGRFVVTTEGTERIRIGPSGQFGLGGANYGTSGQVIVSNGSGSAPTWQSNTSVNVTTAQDSTNDDFYIPFKSTLSGSAQLKTDSGLQYNPSTNALKLVSGNFVGDGSQLTNISNTTNITTAQDDTNDDFYIPFKSTLSGSGPLKTDSGIKYNPSTNALTLTSGNFVGDGSQLTNISNTTNITTASDSTNDVFYIPFKSTLSGSGPLKTDSALKYNPSTDTLTSGNFVGNGSGLTNVSASGTGIDDYVKYVGTGTPNLNSSTSYTELSWINTTPNLANGTWSATSEHIVVPVDGIYLVQLNFYMTASLARSTVGVRFAINDSQQSEIQANNYIRNSGGQTESSTHLSSIYNMDANDQLSVYTRRLAVSGTVSLQGTNSTIAITLLKAI